MAVVAREGTLVGLAGHSILDGVVLAESGRGRNYSFFLADASVLLPERWRSGDGDGKHASVSHLITPMSLLMASIRLLFIRMGNDDRLRLNPHQAELYAEGTPLKVQRSHSN